MTDRDMLLVIYGALKAMKSVNQDLLTRLERHLFPEGQKKQ